MLAKSGEREIEKVVKCSRTGIGNRPGIIESCYVFASSRARSLFTRPFYCVAGYNATQRQLTFPNDCASRLSLDVARFESMSFIFRAPSYTVTIISISLSLSCKMIDTRCNRRKFFGTLYVSLRFFSLCRALEKRNYAKFVSRCF